MPKKPELHFDIHASIVFQLGENLVTDLVQALVELVKKYKIDQVQTRPLAIDPLQYIEVAKDRGAGGEPIGVANLIRLFKKEAPWVTVGNFARGMGERRKVESERAVPGLPRRSLNH